MKINKRKILGFINLFIGVMILWYISYHILGIELILYANVLYLSVSVVVALLALLSGVLTLMGKNWIWSIGGIIAVLVLCTWHLIATAQLYI